MAAIPKDIQRKLFYILRHGKAPVNPETGGSFDTLFPSAIPQIITGSGLEIAKEANDYGVLPDKMFLVHSPRKRARMSGQLALVPRVHGIPDVGKYGFPKDEKELSLDQCDEHLGRFLGDHNVSFIDSQPVNGLGYTKDVGRDAYCNDNVYMRNPLECINFWFQNPNATVQEGVPIEPYTSVRKRTNKAMMEAISRLDPNQPDKDKVKNIGLLCTHALMLESLVANLINTGRDSDIMDIADVGGKFDYSEAAKVIIDVNPKCGSHEAKVHYKDKAYPVDLYKLCNSCKK